MDAKDVAAPAHGEPPSDGELLDRLDELAGWLNAAAPADNCTPWLIRRDLVHVARERLSALLSLVPSLSEWRSIESAPKDGTFFLGYCDGNCDVVRYWGRWEVDDWQPTHWMPLPKGPLPAPPAAAPKDEQA